MFPRMPNAPGLTERVAGALLAKIEEGAFPLALACLRKTIWRSNSASVAPCCAGDLPVEA